MYDKPGSDDFKLCQSAHGMSSEWPAGMSEDNGYIVFSNLLGISQEEWTRLWQLFSKLPHDTPVYCECENDDDDGRKKHNATKWCVKVKAAEFNESKGFVLTDDPDNDFCVISRTKRGFEETSMPKNNRIRGPRNEIFTELRIPIANANGSLQCGSRPPPGWEEAPWLFK